MKMYRYFVSYAYNGKNGNCGVRSCTVERECKIESINDIKSISEALEEQKDVHLCCEHPAGKMSCSQENT